jgi:threonine dehydratase
MTEQKESDVFSIEKIRRAADRISGYVVRTPLLSSPMLDRTADARVWVKPEALQLTGSFKIRGALNKVLGLSEQDRKNGIAAFSAGNHASAVAAAASIVGCPAVIVVPNNAPKIKVENSRWWGAEVIFYDPATEDRAEITQAIADRRGLTIISPFDDHEIMAGAGTTGLEMAEQLIAAGQKPDAVVVNCSGGGLASGVIEAMAHHFPDVEKYIVEPQGYDKMAHSLATGEVRHNPAVRHTIMDGISGPVAGKLPLEVLLRHGVKGLTVDDDEALGAVSAAFYTLKTVIEPGGAASLAAVLSKKTIFAGKTVAIVASGGNVDPAVYIRALTENPLKPA